MQQILNTYTSEMTFVAHLVNLLLTAVVCWVLGQVYIRYGHTLSNRRALARNFMIIGPTTMLIITVVKASIAMSLGLVGALSIVRFRAAIKEPEELAYLFLTIAIGLGFGANLRIVTLASFAFIVAVVILSRRRKPADGGPHNMYMTVLSRDPKSITLAQLVEILRTHAAGVTLKRVDETASRLEASFLLNLEDVTALNAARDALLTAAPDLEITFADSSGLQ